jgi:large subunit ribosomal protein L9
MKVILLQDISRVGKRGEVKEVADGYAINVLIKKGQALLATPGELAKWKSKEDAKRHQRELAENTFAQLLDMLRRHPIVIEGKRHDDKGQLFAQIKDTDIVDAVFAITKMSISHKQVHFPKVVKSLGKHECVLEEGGRKEVIHFTVQ